MRAFLYFLKHIIAVAVVISITITAPTCLTNTRADFFFPNTKAGSTPSVSNRSDFPVGSGKPSSHSSIQIVLQLKALHHQPA